MAPAPAVRCPPDTPLPLPPPPNPTRQGPRRGPYADLRVRLPLRLGPAGRPRRPLQEDRLHVQGKRGSWGVGTTVSTRKASGVLVSAGACGGHGANPLLRLLLLQRVLSASSAAALLRLRHGELGRHVARRLRRAGLAEGPRRVLLARLPLLRPACQGRQHHVQLQRRQRCGPAAGGGEAIGRHRCVLVARAGSGQRDCLVPSHARGDTCE